MEFDDADPISGGELLVTKCLIDDEELTGAKVRRDYGVPTLVLVASPTLFMAEASLMATLNNYLTSYYCPYR